MGSLRKLICENRQQFDLIFGIGVASFSVLFFISVIIVVILCIDNRRRKRVYKHKYRKCSTQEVESIKDLNRALTYLSYKIQNEQLKSVENFKPTNPLALIKDSSMDEHRNVAAANIAYFFAAETRSKGVGGRPPRTPPIGSPQPKIVSGPLKSAIVVVPQPAGTESPPQQFNGNLKQSVGIATRQPTVTAGSPTGTESASNISHKSTPPLVSPQQTSPVESPQQVSPIASPQQSIQAPDKTSYAKEEGVQASIISK